MNDGREAFFLLDHAAGHYEGQGQVYAALPRQAVEGASCPLLIALHGSGRNAQSYRDVAFYRTQRDLALSCGYIFASVTNGPDTYGQPDGLENVEKLYRWMQEHYRVSGKVALWGSSAGGLMMHRFFRRHREEVSLLLGIFPIFDPAGMPLLESMMRAFDASDREDLLRKAGRIGLLPDAFEHGLYKGVKVVVAHGRQDTAVPFSQSLKLQKQVQRDGGEMLLIEKPGGHSTENTALYETPFFRSALLQI